MPEVIELATQTEAPTYRLHDGDSLFYFQDLAILSEFIKTLAEAEVPTKKVWLDTVTMSNTCWEGLPRIDADKI